MNYSLLRLNASVYITLRALALTLKLAVKGNHDFRLFRRRQMLYANPYDSFYEGFYFSSLDEYNDLSEKHPCEEFEIMFIDGDNPKLFASAQISQGNLETWFDNLESISDDDDKAIQLMYLLDIGYKLDDAIERSDEICLFHGSAENYAEELFDDCYEIPDFLASYIDYEKIGRDLGLNGEITEFYYNIFITNANEF